MASGKKKAENTHPLSVFCPHFYLSQSVISFYLSTNNKHLPKKWKKIKMLRCRTEGCYTKDKTPNKSRDVKHIT